MCPIRNTTLLGICVSPWNGSPDWMLPERITRDMEFAGQVKTPGWLAGHRAGIIFHGYELRSSCMMCHEFDLQHPQKTQVWRTVLPTRTPERDRQIPWGSLAKNLGDLLSSRSMRNPISKNKVGTPEERQLRLTSGLISCASAGIDTQLNIQQLQLTGTPTQGQRHRVSVLAEGWWEHFHLKVTGA